MEMQIYFTDAAALAAPLPDVVSPQDAQRRAAEFRHQFVPDGLPFILGPDGSYHWALNRFFHSLPTWGSAPSGAGEPTGWTC
jgi:hypothetical protein